MYNTEPTSEFMYRVKKLKSPYIIPGMPSLEEKIRIWTKIKPIKEKQRQRLWTQEQCDRILTVVCNEFSVPPELVKSPRRFKEMVDARSAYYYVLRYKSAMSLKDISKSLGLCQDHSTVIYAISKCQTALHIRDAFGLKLENIIQSIEEDKYQQEHPAT